VQAFHQLKELQTRHDLRRGCGVALAGNIMRKLRIDRRIAANGAEVVAQKRVVFGIDQLRSHAGLDVQLI